MGAIVSVREIRDEDEYDRAVESLNALLDDGAGDERHPMSAMVDKLGELIVAYDAAHFPNAEVSASAMLQFLMGQHGLTASQLPEVGGADTVSGILNGMRNPTPEQIAALSQRFNVPDKLFR